ARLVCGGLPAAGDFWSGCRTASAACTPGAARTSGTARAAVVLFPRLTIRLGACCCESRLTLAFEFYGDVAQLRESLHGRRTCRLYFGDRRLSVALRLFGCGERLARLLFGHLGFCRCLRGVLAHGDGHQLGGFDSLHTVVGLSGGSI